MASNRLRAVNQNEGEAAEMDMSPMIDMVFLLLLFFLVVSNPKTIKIDAEVVPSVAENARAAKTVKGKIVINVRKDGTFLDESQNKTFDDDKAMSDYIKEQREKIDNIGYQPVLHIRADKETDFSNTRRVIRAGAAAGVQQLAYGVYNKE